eukprot:3384896-Amphidinium_carterae.1
MGLRSTGLLRWTGWAAGVARNEGNMAEASCTWISAGNPEVPLNFCPGGLLSGGPGEVPTLHHHPGPKAPGAVLRRP